MKIIHFSDAHIDFGANMGKLDPVTRMSGRVLDCLDMIDSVIDFAEDEKADLIIFAGDAFHRYNPNPIFTAAFAERVGRMLNLCPVVLLVGNHDMSPATSAVEIYDKLQLQDLYIGNDYQVFRIETKSGVIQVATAPYPSRRTLGEKYTKEILADKIYHLGDTITADDPAILVGHFTVGGSRYGAERDYVFGEDASVDLETLTDGTWDYVALGHIHFHQCLNEDPPVVYAGSVDRVTFGEEHETKGFVLVEITDRTKWEFIALDARPYKSIEIKTLKSDPMPKILSKIKSLDLERAVVKVSIYVKEEYRKRVDQAAILDLLDTKNLCMVTSLVIYPIRSELATNRSDEMNIMTDMSHREMLLNYLIGIGIEKSERTALMKLASDIMQKVEVDNVDSK